MMTQRSTLAVQCRTARSAALGPANQSWSPNQSYRQVLANGTGSEQSDEVYAVTETITQGTSEEWDLKSGGAGDHDCPGLEGDIDFATIKTIYVESDPDNVVDIQVGGAAANTFDAMFNGVAASVATIQPGGVLVMNAPKTGWTVDATNKMLQIEAEAGAANPSVTLKLVGVAN